MCNCNHNEFELLPELELLLNQGHSDFSQRRHHHHIHQMNNLGYEYETPDPPVPGMSAGGQMIPGGVFMPTACQTPAVNMMPDYLDARLGGCVNTTVAGVNTAYLFEKTLKANRWRPIWIKLLKPDPGNLLKVLYPQVSLTVELWQFITIPDGHMSYALEPLRDYLLSKGNRYAVSIFLPFGPKAKAAVERLANISLDKLVAGAGALPDKLHSYYLHVYATFPDSIKTHLRHISPVDVDNFEFNKYTISAPQQQLIRQVATDIFESWMSGSTLRYAEVTLAGHTDIRGTEGYNMELGKKRATAVADALKAQISQMATGIMDVSKMNISYQIVSYGETRPISKRPPINHALNRRVEITLQGTKMPASSTLKVADTILRLMNMLRVKQSALDKETFNRLQCLLKAMQNRRIDDRYIGGNTAILAINNGKPIPSPKEWGRVRFQLATASLFGPQLSPDQLLHNLMSIDYSIREAIAQIDHITKYNSGVPLIGAMSTAKSLIQILDWIKNRADDRNSIYYCYR